MPFLASCPPCGSVGVKSSCWSEMLAPQQRDTYTLFMVRWLHWKQDLSHINHKRFELGQDSCKGTEIRQCILYFDTIQKVNVLHARIKMDPSPLLWSLLFLFKISEAFLCPLCVLMSWLLSLGNVCCSWSSVTHCYYQFDSVLTVMETGSLLWERLLTADG